MSFIYGFPLRMGERAVLSAYSTVPLFFLMKGNFAFSSPFLNESFWPWTMFLGEEKLL